MNVDITFQVLDMGPAPKNYYVIKRPGVDAFLKAMSKLYEVAIFTASHATYGNEVMDQLDPNNYCTMRLY